VSSDKDKEVSALFAQKEFVSNQFTTMEKEVSLLLGNKNMKLAQATEAAQKLQQTVEELQVASQKEVDENGRLQEEAVNSQYKILVLEGKLQEIHSSAEEKGEEIQKLKVSILKLVSLGKSRSAYSLGDHLMLCDHGLIY
jgi:hypothetical protein